MAKTNQTEFKDTLNLLLGGMVDQQVLSELWSNYYNKYIDTNVSLDLVPDLLVGSKDTPLFNKEYAGYLKIKSNPDDVTGITTLADFMNARQSYKDIFSSYGLSELATNDNVDKFLENNVSVIEAQSRMSIAYQAIQNADLTLKQQLGDLGLSDKDLAKALLTGKEGAVQLEDKIKTANVRAAEVDAGIKSLLGAQELARQGISRSEAAQGLSITKMQLPGYAAEATRQGQDATTIQSELEKENVLGLASQRRKKLQQSGKSTFSGTSGTMQTSLNKSALGSI
jgi:hypothetical protein